MVNSVFATTPTTNINKKDNKHRLVTPLAASYQLPEQLVEQALERAVAAVENLRQCQLEQAALARVAAGGDFDDLTAVLASKDSLAQAGRLYQVARTALHQSLKQASHDYYTRWVKPLQGSLVYFTVEVIGERASTGSLSFSLEGRCNNYTQEQGESLQRWSSALREGAGGGVANSFTLPARLPARWQVETEDYKPGQCLAVYIQEVNRVAGLPGVEVVVSRTCRGLVRALLEETVPDFHRHFEIVGIERQLGTRSQVWIRPLVAAFRQTGVDSGSATATRGKTAGRSHHGATHNSSPSGNPKAAPETLPASAPRIGSDYLAEITALLWGEMLEIIYV